VLANLQKCRPYDQSANTVGILSTNVNTILTSSAPVTAGTAAIQLQAKPSNTTSGIRLCRYLNAYSRCRILAVRIFIDKVLVIIQNTNQK
jgi:hypothetical protein